MMRTRRGFTMVEVTLAVALFSAMAFVLMDFLTTENRDTAALMDDLTVNNEARTILELVTKDVRSATEVGMTDAQIRADADTIGIDESKGQIVLRYSAPAVEPGSADLKRFQIKYYLVGKTMQPPQKLPQAKPRSYTFLGQGLKWFFPLVRETATLDPAGNATLKDIMLVGWVRELAFYQTQPTNIGVASLPTVYIKLVMSAFKQGPSRDFIEAYREDFSTCVTARSIVPTVTGRSQ